MPSVGSDRKDDLTASFASTMPRVTMVSQALRGSPTGQALQGSPYGPLSGHADFCCHGMVPTGLSAMGSRPTGPSGLVQCRLDSAPQRHFMGHVGHSQHVGHVEVKAPGQVQSVLTVLGGQAVLMGEVISSSAKTGSSTGSSISGMRGATDDEGQETTRAMLWQVMRRDWLQQRPKSSRGGPICTGCGQFALLLTRVMIEMGRPARVRWLHTRHTRHTRHIHGIHGLYGLDGHMG